MLGLAFVSSYLGGPALLSGQKTVKSIPETSLAATGNSLNFQKSLNASGDTFGEDPASSAQATDPPKERATAKPAMSNASMTTSCTVLTERLMKSYADQVKKEKVSLDETLSFLGTLTFSSKYVEDHNAKISSLYKQTADAAAAEQCTLPLSAPELLPATYPY
jgi:hypothetical protein